MLYFWKTSLPSHTHGFILLSQHHPTGLYLTQKKGVTPLLFVLLFFLFANQLT